MSDKRKTDAMSYTKFRASRFFQEGGKWYFFTREGTIEGSFASRADAQERLQEYIKVMSSGFIPANSSLAIEPHDDLQAEAPRVAQGGW